MKKKALLVARALAAMGPGAVNVGRADLASGVEFAVEVGKKSGLPWLSSNIRLADGSAPFPTYKRLKWGELDVVVVAATPKYPRLDPGLGIEVLEPISAIKKALAKAGEADVVIALSDLGYQEEHVLARALPQLHIIVGGGNGNRMIKEPLKLGGTLLLRVADRGRHLGVFKVTPTEGKFPKPFRWKKISRANVEALEAFGNQLAQARKNGSGEDDPVLKTIRELQKKAAKAPPKSNGANYANRIVFLSKAISDDPSTAKAVTEFKAWQREFQVKSNAAAAQKRRDATGQKLPTPAAKPTASPAPKPQPQKAAAPPKQKEQVRTAPPPKAKATPAAAQKFEAQPKKQSWYLGTMKCRECHTAQFRQWIATGHSRSGSLLPPDKGADAACRACHIVRLEVARGFSSEGFVGCERCHGQGSDHPEEMTGEKSFLPAKSKLRRKVSRKVCLECHRGEHNETFIFEQDYQRVRCDR